MVPIKEWVFLPQKLQSLRFDAWLKALVNCLVSANQLLVKLLPKDIYYLDEVSELVIGSLEIHDPDCRDTLTLHLCKTPESVPGHAVHQRNLHASASLCDLHYHVIYAALFLHFFQVYRDDYHRCVASLEVLAHLVQSCDVALFYHSDVGLQFSFRRLQLPIVIELFELEDQLNNKLFEGLLLLKIRLVKINILSNFA